MTNKPVTQEDMWRDPSRPFFTPRNAPTLKGTAFTWQNLNAISPKQLSYIKSMFNRFDVKDSDKQLDYAEVLFGESFHRDWQRLSQRAASWLIDQLKTASPFVIIAERVAYGDDYKREVTEEDLLDIASQPLAERIASWGGFSIEKEEGTNQ